jgi:hypothetical protein
VGEKGDTMNRVIDYVPGMTQALSCKCMIKVFDIMKLFHDEQMRPTHKMGVEAIFLFDSEFQCSDFIEFLKGCEDIPIRKIYEEIQVDKAYTHCGYVTKKLAV